MGDLPVGTRVGEYEITGVLGEGGMGTVYAGVHPIIEKKVAIKVIRPEYAASSSLVGRFIQEARAVNKIEHPNIIDIFAFGESEQVGHYFVMPHLEGESLGERLRRRGPFSLDEALPILEQTTDALDATHEAGIYHRDLKPDNVFLCPARRGGYKVQLLDFGVAKLVGDGAVSATRTGAVMGTPLFMSPEQWDGAEVDQRTDIYALGILIHHMLTGRFPFESKSPVALMNMHARQPPMAPSTYGAPAVVDAVVARALEKDRDERYQSAGELYRALSRAAAGESVATTSHRVVPEVAPTVPSTTLHGAAAQAVVDVTAPPIRRWVGGGLLVAATVVVVVGGFIVTAEEPIPERRGDAPVGGKSAPPEKSEMVDAGLEETAPDADRADGGVVVVPVVDAAPAQTEADAGDGSMESAGLKEVAPPDSGAAGNDEPNKTSNRSSNRERGNSSGRRDRTPPTRTTTPKRDGDDKAGSDGAKETGWGQTSDPF